MQKIQLPGCRPIFAWVDGVPFEEEAQKQVQNLASMPFVHHHVAVMPDVHAGKGSTVGCVFGSLDYVIPAAVGVDIGCGMTAAKLSLMDGDGAVFSPVPLTVDFLSKTTERLGHDCRPDIRKAIEAAVPHGRTDDGGANDRGAWGTAFPEFIVDRWFDDLYPDMAAIECKHPGAIHRRPLNQLGTLGTGNHFIELCYDKKHELWVLLHSGSRGPGNKIGSYFTKIAKEKCSRYHVRLPDPDLAYLPKGDPEYDDYLFAVRWAQSYARINREIMLIRTVNAIGEAIGERLEASETIMCHHNYVEKEHHFGKDVWLTRKGAVRARVGDLCIIPGSMGARSYIAKGLGNPDSFTTCSHGAGRVMSRTAAKKKFTVEDHIKATDGVECRKDAEVIDETPAAYKDIDMVMAAQTDLVEPIHELKQLICVKG